MRDVRGHHLFCMTLFSGHGYDQAFAENMAQLIDTLQAGESFRLVLEQDSVCSACPNRQADGGCTLGTENVLHRDRAALEVLGLSAGQELDWAQARKRLKKAQVDVWQGPYPSEETIADDIRKGDCFMLLYGGAPAGCFSLVGPGEEYHDSDLTDGKWHGEAPYVVLRRNMVSGKFAGSGMSDHEMRFVEEMAKHRGASSIRLLTHKKNLPMKHLLQRHGYRFAGNVELEVQPGRIGQRQAFEKVLK